MFIFDNNEGILTTNKLIITCGIKEHIHHNIITAMTLNHSLKLDGNLKPFNKLLIIIAITINPNKPSAIYFIKSLIKAIKYANIIFISCNMLIIKLSNKTQIIPNIFLDLLTL